MLCSNGVRRQNDPLISERLPQTSSSLPCCLRNCIAAGMERRMVCSCHSRSWGLEQAPQTPSLRRRSGSTAFVASSLPYRAQALLHPPPDEVAGTLGSPSRLDFAKIQVPVVSSAPQLQSCPWACTAGSVPGRQNRSVDGHWAVSVAGMQGSIPLAHMFASKCPRLKSKSFTRSWLGIRTLPGRRTSP